MGTDSKKSSKSREEQKKSKSSSSKHEKRDKYSKNERKRKKDDDTSNLDDESPIKRGRTEETDFAEPEGSGTGGEISLSIEETKYVRWYLPTLINF